MSRQGAGACHRCAGPLGLRAQRCACARLTLPAFAADMAALMDHLGHAQFAVGGISGGGPYAAGVAACLASRVTALALVSPMGPVGDPAKPAGAVALPSLLLRGPAARSPRAIAAVFAFSARASSARRVSPRDLATLRAGARDKALLARPDIARWLLGSFREGLEAAAWPGRCCDLQLFSRTGASTSGPSARRRICGSAPPILRCRLARLGCWHARSLHATLTELPDDGHFWVAASYGEVLSGLRRRCGAGEPKRVDQQWRDEPPNGARHPRARPPGKSQSPPASGRRAAPQQSEHALEPIGDA